MESYLIYIKGSKSGNSFVTLARYYDTIIRSYIGIVETRLITLIRNLIVFVGKTLSFSNHFINSSIILWSQYSGPTQFPAANCTLKDIWVIDTNGGVKKYIYKFNLRTSSSVTVVYISAAVYKCIIEVVGCQYVGVKLPIFCTYNFIISKHINK